MPDSWSDRRPTSRRRSEPLEQRFDRLVSAGRQLVDGVSGARPGARPAARPGLPRLDGLGRWVENKLDWILEDEDDWREPWQQARPDPRLDPPPSPRPSVPSRRRRLEAISRRTVEPLAAESDWPDDDAFTLPRWQRQVTGNPPDREPGASATQGSRSGRILPRSNRRRPAD